MKITQFLGTLLGALTHQKPARRPTATFRQSSGQRRDAAESASPSQTGPLATREIDPPGADGLTLSYAPDRDGDADAGEVVWTWVPYEEADGRGKDRPVLIIGQQSTDRVFAVKLTSKSRDGNRGFIEIGPGAWDSQGRPSWVDIDQIYSVHRRGLRREAAALDRARYDRVAQELSRRYGWVRA